MNAMGNPTECADDKAQQHVSDPDGSEGSFKKACFSSGSNCVAVEEMTAELTKRMMNEDDFEFNAVHIYDDGKSGSSKKQSSGSGYGSCCDGSVYDVNVYETLTESDDDTIKFCETSEELAAKLTHQTSSISSALLKLDNNRGRGDMRLPMSLPAFKPAVGCTDGSEFVIRCFIARLRAGITVLKYSRSRWCKSSHYRTLQISSDGCFLTWKPAEDEHVANAWRSPRLDLSQCVEVRHASTRDQQDPRYTGTANLRKKCKPYDVQHSLSLVFHKRTFDMTAVSLDQCKILLAGFSALCYHLHIAVDRKKTTKSGIRKDHHLREKDTSTTMAGSSRSLTKSFSNRS